MNQPTNETELIAALATLQPLRKVHYSFSFPKELVAKRELLKQVIRINRSGAGYGDYDVPGHLDTQWQVMKELGVKEFSLNHSPWNGTDLSMGADFSSRVAKYISDLSSRAKQIADLNTKYGTNIYVTSVCIDQEQYHPTPETADAINLRNNLSYELVKNLFPEAAIIQYGRGDYQWVDGPKKVFPYYTLDERGEYYSCSLYNLTEIPAMRNKFSAVLSWVSLRGNSQFEVIPFVALGGYIPRTLGNQNTGWQWKDYPLNFSWTMGAELNHPWYSDPVRSVMYAEWNRAPFVWFWPSCFDTKATTYGLHYLAYVMGCWTLKEDWLLN